MVVPPVVPDAAETSSPLQVAFGRSLRQRRVVVFFRPLLSVPQLVVLYFLNIAAVVLVFLGWFAALVTGRLPVSFASFVIGYLRWRARVEAYLYLLTDKYPPFSLETEPDYPVDVAVRTGRLNRWSVLFRYFLALPAALAAGFLAIGASIFWIVTWVATLIKGEVPQSLFEANAAALRYEYRLFAYFTMLTSFYPAEVMGDAAPTPGTMVPPVPAFQVPVNQPPVPFPGPGLPGAQSYVPPPPVPGTPPYVPPPPVPGTQPYIPPPPVPGTQPFAAPAPVPGVAPPPPPVPGTQPFATPAPAPAPGAAPPPPQFPPYPFPSLAPDIGVQPSDRWRLVLSPGARRLVVTYFIVGVLGVAAYVGILAAVTSSGVSTTNQAITAQNELIAAYNLVGQQSQVFASTTKACASSQGTTVSQCLATADGQLASELQAYQHTVSTIDFPSQVAPQVAAVSAAATSAGAKLEQLSQLGSDPQAYSAAANNSGLVTVFDQVDSTTRTLNSALLNL